VQCSKFYMLISHAMFQQNEFFKVNPRFESFLTGLVPTFLVVLLGLLIPIILFAIGRKLQTTVTWSELHSGILQRYYK